MLYKTRYTDIQYYETFIIYKEKVNKNILFKKSNKGQ